MIVLRGMSFVYTFQRYSDNALYKKLGFVEDELIEESGYPHQRFILYAK